MLRTNFLPDPWSTRVILEHRAHPANAASQLRLSADAQGHRVVEPAAPAPESRSHDAMVAIATVARIRDALRRADPHDVMAVLPGLINEIGPSLHQLPPQRQRIATPVVTFDTRHHVTK